LLAGCSDRILTELKTNDGKIQITIKDPSECDESRFTYGIVKGLDPTQPHPKIILCLVSCSSYVDTELFILLEGSNWCAVAMKDEISEDSKSPLEAVYAIIDRGSGRVYEYPDSFPECPKAIMEEVANEVKKQRSGTK